jgi:hypothetical protein
LLRKCRDVPCPEKNRVESVIVTVARMPERINRSQEFLTWFMISERFVCVLRQNIMEAAGAYDKGTSSSHGR